MTAWAQTSLDELGTPLREVTFVVVDLETTGGSPADCAITEIGAVKVRGGEVLAEFATLVYPARAIPPFIAVLTGITDAMVASAPPITAVLPAFLEFAAGAVLVAHNARFDVGFLKAACADTSRRWPSPPTVDTALLARRVLSRDDVPDCRLASLAVAFRAPTAPNHRALVDARATVAVLHGLLERVGGLGVQSLEELTGLVRAVSPAQAAKRRMADRMPRGPGVYLFRDATGRALYVGCSKDVRARVRSYFLAGEQRRRIAEMVGLAERVDAVPCAHELEARVRELRLIAAHQPPYNRRSKFPERAYWLTLTSEPFPRLSVVRAPRGDRAGCLGPFGSAAAAAAAAEAILQAVPLRACRRRIGRRGGAGPACALAEIGRCAAPCVGGQSVADYARHVEAARQVLAGRADQVAAAARGRMAALAGAGRFEEAGAHRDRLLAYLRAAARWQRLSALAAVPLLAAAARSPTGGWELAVIRHGRLAAAGRCPAGVPVRPHLAALLATAETVRTGPGPTPCATAEEMEVVLGWLARPDARVASLEGTWASPVPAAAAVLAELPPAVHRAPAVAPSAVLPSPRGVRDHRDRAGQVRRRPHPGGRRADRRAARGVGGLLGDR